MEKEPPKRSPKYLDAPNPFRAPDWALKFLTPVAVRHRAYYYAPEMYVNTCPTVNPFVVFDKPM